MTTQAQNKTRAGTDSRRRSASVTLPMPHVDGVEHRFVDVNGTRFHVAEAGTGEPLVLLHGWPQHWWSWREVIGPLANHYRVICPDIRGMGWSGGADGDMSWNGLVRDLVGQLDALGLDRVRFVGHDWGLLVGYRGCLTHPERIERFAALAGVHIWQGRSSPPRVFTRAWHVFALSALGKMGLTRFGIAERALRKWRHCGAFTEAEAAIYMSALRRPSSVEASIKFDRNLTMYEIPHGIREFKNWYSPVPTLHLLGEFDPLTPVVPDSYEPYTEEMRIEVIPKCGHFIPEEAPRALVEHLLAFLSPVTAADERNTPSDMRATANVAITAQPSNSTATSGAYRTKISS